MEMLHAFNVSPEDVERGWPGLYARRRDSFFSFACRRDGKVFAGRDRVGAAPLYYRVTEGHVDVSPNITDLVRPGDRMDELGVRTQTPGSAPSWRST